MRSPTEKHYIYVLFRENGAPFYVGKGAGRRWDDHEMGARAGNRGRRFTIIRAMLRDGFEIPKVKIHEGLTEAVAYEYERALIKAIGRMPNGPLVNVTEGGDSVRLTSEGIARMRASKIGVKRPQNVIAAIASIHLGKKFSPEHRAKLVAAKLGTTASLETRMKRSASLKGRKRPPEVIAKLRAANLGKKQSSVTIAKRTAGQRGRKLSPEHIANARAGRLAAMARRRAIEIGG